MNVLMVECKFHSVYTCTMTKEKHYMTIHLERVTWILLFFLYERNHAIFHTPHGLTSQSSAWKFRGNIPVSTSSCMLYWAISPFHLVYNTSLCQLTFISDREAI